MTPKSLFIIILRVIGLFLLVDILRVIPQLLSTFEVLLHGGDMSAAISAVILSILIVLIYFYVVRYVLFRADKLVEKLALDKNFTEEKFDLNIHRSTVIKIAIIIIGGITFIESFVPLILDVFIFIRQKNNHVDYDTVNTIPIIKNLLMVLVGYFLISNSRTITNWTEKKRRG